MALELSELRSFVVLANHLHFGKAAEALHLSQPALTKQIQRLEDKVAGPLLIRGYRRVTLTPAGEILRDRAREATGAFREDAQNAIYAAWSASRRTSAFLIRNWRRPTGGSS